jgi:hypothetical protein
MELDVSLDPHDSPVVSVFDLPEEIQLKLLYLLDPLDILALGRTCRFYAKHAESEPLW